MKWLFACFEGFERTMCVGLVKVDDFSDSTMLLWLCWYCCVARFCAVVGEYTVFWAARVLSSNIVTVIKPRKAIHPVALRCLDKQGNEPCRKINTLVRSTFSTRMLRACVVSSPKNKHEATVSLIITLRTILHRARIARLSVRRMSHRFKFDPRISFVRYSWLDSIASRLDSFTDC